MALLPPILTDLPIVDDAWLIAQATASIRAYCGWHVAPVITETIHPESLRGRDLLVKSLKLRDIVGCRIKGTDGLAGLSWSENGIVRRSGGWPDGYQLVELDIEHGFDADDTPLPGLIVDLVNRAKSAPAGVMLSQTAGPFSATWGAQSAGAASAHVPLLGSEQVQLNRYRLTWGL